MDNGFYKEIEQYIMSGKPGPLWRKLLLCRYLVNARTDDLFKDVFIKLGQLNAYLSFSHSMRVGDILLTRCQSFAHCFICCVLLEQTPFFLDSCFFGFINFGIKMQSDGKIKLAKVIFEFADFIKRQHFRVWGKEWSHEIIHNFRFLGQCLYIYKSSIYEHF